MSIEAVEVDECEAGGVGLKGVNRDTQTEKHENPVYSSPVPLTRARHSAPQTTLTTEKSISWLNRGQHVPSNSHGSAPPPPSPHIHTQLISDVIRVLITFRPV